MDGPSPPSLIEEAAVATTAAVEWKIAIEGTDAFGEVRRREIRVDKSWDRLFDGEIGLSVEDGKKIMAALQTVVVSQEADTYTLFRRICPDCGVLRPVKDYTTRRVRTVFGTVEVRNPRWMLCRNCHPGFALAFAPLCEICPDCATPELRELTARLGSMMPYRQAASVLAEFLPLEPTETHATVRKRTVRTGVLTIDLAALRANWRFMAERASPAVCGAVVKADAYGLGAAEVGVALYREGCRHFFVAHLAEALALRPVLPSDVTLYVLNGLMPDGEALTAAQCFVPVLNSLEQVRRWACTAAERGERLPCVLQFDTGMSRLGLSADEAAELRADPGLLAALDLRFVMSHLASADEPENEQNLDQLAAMQVVEPNFAGTPVSIANSGGVLLGSAWLGAMVRPGIALYGGNPRASGPNWLRQVVKLQVRVIQTRTVAAGARIGYSGTHVAATPMRLATIAAGYADGLPRSLSSHGAAWFEGVRLPIVGRVSMDSVTLDISKLRPNSLTLGSLVELIGEDQSLEDLARDAGTISYEILTSLGRRYQRLYISAPARANREQP
jgi:alanine racemase